MPLLAAPVPVEDATGKSVFIGEPSVGQKNLRRHQLILATESVANSEMLPTPRPGTQRAGQKTTLTGSFNLRTHWPVIYEQGLLWGGSGNPRSQSGVGLADGCFQRFPR